MKYAYDRLMTQHPDLTEVLLIPLYPHYAMSSYETAVEYAREIHAKGKYPFRITAVQPFYDNPLYIGALSESMKPYLEEGYDHVLFSYHGLPRRHMKKADPTGSHCLRSENCCSVNSIAHKTCYRHQVYTTTKKTAQLLGIPSDKYSVSFQSRLGREEWIHPYTVDELAALGGRGVKRLLVVCPAFVSDCLETLEEMGVEGKDLFLKSGGESFTLIPCMNTHPGWVGVLASWVKSIHQGDKSLTAPL
jgi:ferrochelatase